MEEQAHDSTAEVEPEARDRMQVAELAYRPTGQALCVFFGPTPASDGPDPVTASPVNPVGTLPDPFAPLKRLGRPRSRGSPASRSSLGDGREQPHFAVRQIKTSHPRTDLDPETLNVGHTVRRWRSTRTERMSGRITVNARWARILSY